MTLADVLTLPPTLTADEVAPILRVSRGAVYDALRDGSIPSFRLGRRVLIPTAEFARVVLGLDVTAASQTSPDVQVAGPWLRDLDGDRS